MEIKEIQKFH